MKLNFAIATVCATLLFSCSPNREANPVSNISSKRPVTIQGTGKMKFDHQHHPSGIGCPNLGSNCGLPPKPTASYLLSDFDNVIANGPSAIGTYFSTVNGDWNLLFPGIDTDEPTVYADLAAGNYSITKVVSGTNSYYYIGTGSLVAPVGPSNFSYVYMF